MTRIKHSPWGAVQTTRTHAPGITFVSTASHGGFHLSPERIAEYVIVADCFNHFGPQWFEEDCEATLIYLAFPSLATSEMIDAAERTIRSAARWDNNAGPWQDVVDWFDAPEQSELRQQAEHHRQSVAHLWERGSMACGRDLPAGCWDVGFRRGTERRQVVMPYPEKRFYTDAELCRLNREHAPA